MKRVFTIISIGLLSFATPMAAQAQVQLPQFSISNIPTIEFDDNAPIDNSRAFNDIDNEIMRDTLRLQYQINLLESLIRRQTEIQRIAQSYEAIGLPFKQPAPPQSTCDQLPVNILCMAFYPESDTYKGLIDERRAEAERERQRQLDQMMVNLNFGDYEETPAISNTGQATPAPRARRVPKPDEVYMWSDIRCLAGACTALLTKRDDTSIRFRVKDGDDLPTGGTVTSISAEGVETRLDGESYTLLAQAVGETQQAQAPSRQNNVADLLNENLGESANDSPAMQEAMAAQEDEAIGPQTVGSDSNSSGVPDVLGVTGLF